MIGHLQNLKNSLCERVRLKKWKDNLQTVRKYLQTIYPTKVLYLEYIKISQKSAISNPIRRWEKDINRHLIEEILMPNKHTQRCVISLVNEEIKTKTTVRYD